MLVRDAVPDDIPALASIHVRAFPGFFLSRMGARFVQDYYASVASDPSGWILVGETGGRIVGAAVGFGDPARFYRSYRSRPVRLLVPVLGAVVSDPRLIPLVTPARPPGTRSWPPCSSTPTTPAPVRASGSSTPSSTGPGPPATPECP
jgi:hypothetical protein